MIHLGSYSVIQNGSRGFFVPITSAQLRAARGLIGWSQTQLAQAAQLSLPTVKRVESGAGPRVSDDARARLKGALEAAGIDFIDENGGGPGVRLRKRSKPRVR